VPAELQGLFDPAVPVSSTRGDLRRGLASRTMRRTMTRTTPTCLACGRNDDETPLVRLLHRGAELHICPQHLPILIHNPGELVGRLAGAERLKPAEHHD